ncbi:MAG TPA: STAS domain-containing protein [Tepidisphaeraceae bacterium]|nr:STAS domain-containing protein [Tepidisphaeraceae bacterium]
MPELPTNQIVPTARLDGDTIIAAVRGEIDLHNSPALRTALLGAVNKYHPKKIILNLDLVPYMDSSAIAVLVETLQKLRKIGGKVVLTNLQPRVKGLLEIARLNTVFVLVADEAEAMKA